MTMRSPVGIALAMLQGAARLASSSPELRARAVTLLSRAPRVKRALKRALAHANTIASRQSSRAAPIATDEAFLSVEARRVLRDLERARARMRAAPDRN